MLHIHHQQAYCQHQQHIGLYAGAFLWQAAFIGSWSIAPNCASCIRLDVRSVSGKANNPGEGGSILLHLVKAVLLILQGLAPKGNEHLPHGGGGVQLLLEMVLLGLHALQAAKPGCKVAQPGVPLLQLPAAQALPR